MDFDQHCLETSLFNVVEFVLTVRQISGSPKSKGALGAATSHCLFSWQLLTHASTWQLALQGVL
jgi:hypothetical protein